MFWGLLPTDGTAPPSIPPSTPAFSPSLGHTRFLSQGLCSGSFYVRKPRCCHPSPQNHSPAPYGNCCPQKLPLEPSPPLRSYDLPTGLLFKACFPPDSAPSSTWPVCPLPGPGSQATLSHRGRGEWTRCAKPQSRGRPQAENPDGRELGSAWRDTSGGQAQASDPCSPRSSVL